MIKRQTVASVLTTTALAFCIAASAAEAASMASAAQATSAAAADPRGLQREIRSAITADPFLRGAHIAVFTSDGDVTLAGVVSTEEQRGRAQKVATAVRGVRRVDNVIEVADR
jgi:hyperosmotically inducible periplasmic protein